MIRLWHIAVFVLVLAASAVALAPARAFVHPAKGAFAYREVEGTIWQATFRQAQIGGLDAGDIRMAVSFPDLLTGRLTADFDLKGQEIAGRARLETTLSGDKRVATPGLTITGVALQGFGPLPGQTSLSGLDIRFENRACKAAQGQLQSNSLALAAEQLGVQGPDLSGTASCAGNVARLMLTGERDGDAAQALIDLANDGTGAWKATYRTVRPAVAAAVMAAGLAPEPDGALGSKGTTTWFPF